MTAYVLLVSKWCSVAAFLGILPHI